MNIDELINKLKEVLNNLHLNTIEENEVIFGNDSEDSDFEINVNEEKPNFEPGQSSNKGKEKEKETQESREPWRKRSREQRWMNDFLTSNPDYYYTYAYKKGNYKNKKGEWSKPKKGPKTLKP